MCDSFQQVLEKRTLMCVGVAARQRYFIFSSFTYDAFVIALLMLGIALFVTEYLSEEKNSNKTDDGIYSCYGCGMLFKGGLYSIFGIILAYAEGQVL